MSVTFEAEPVNTGRVIVQGWMPDEYEVGPTPVASFDSYESFTAHVNAAGGREALWTEWEWYVVAESITSELPSVNMANDNARDVLFALDLLSDDLCGSEDASTFRARVLVALATERLDDESPAFTWTETEGATVHYCGRRAGYVGDRLAALLAVAEAAEAVGVRVTWG